MPVHAKCKLVKKEQLKDDIFKFGVEVGEELKNALPGQFIEIRVTDRDRATSKKTNKYTQYRREYSRICIPSKRKRNRNTI